DFRYPFHHLRIRGRLPLRHHLLDELDRALDLLRRHVLDRIAMLDLVLARHQQSEDLEICRRLRPAHLRNGLLPMHGEIPQQRANHRLAQPVTRATQSSGWVAERAPMVDRPRTRPRREIDPNFAYNADTVSLAHTFSLGIVGS